MRRASRSLSGGNSSARSPSTSAVIPPAPTIITAPNTGSFFAPTISSNPSAERQHWLNRDAFDLGIRTHAAGAADHFVKHASHFGVVRNASHDAMDLRLMGDLRRVHFHDHGIVNALCNLDGLRRGPGRLRRGRRDAKRPEQFLRLNFGERTAAGCHEAVNLFAGQIARWSPHRMALARGVS